MDFLVKTSPCLINNSNSLVNIKVEHPFAKSIQILGKGRRGEIDDEYGKASMLGTATI